jgi:predicted amidohydrolase YtcJ
MTEAKGAARTEAQPSDVAFVADALITPARSEQTTVVVRDGRIAAIGDQELARAVADSGGRLERVPGVIAPGFVDAHTHIGHLAYGDAIGAVDCRAPEVGSIADLLDTLSTALVGRSRDEPLVGYGNLFYDFKLADQRLPNRADLDKVSATRPIILRAGGHASVLNTAALRAAGIDEAGRMEMRDVDAADTGHARIALAADGRPTGVVGEVDARLPLPKPTAEQIHEAMASVLDREYLAHGVTTIGNMTESITEAGAFASLAETSAMAQRAAIYLMIEPDRALEWLTSIGGQTLPNRLHVRGLKVFADGGFSSRNAATLQEYLPDDLTPQHWHGQISITPAQLDELADRALDAAIDLAIHVNGERAQDFVLSRLAARATLPRIRLEHAGNFLTDLSQVERWNAIDATAVLTPAFLYSYIGDFFPRILGPAARQGRLPARSLLERGAALAVGSDAGLGAEREQTDPLFQLWCLTERRGFLGDVIEPEQALGVEDALRLLTIDSARAVGLDHRVGSIEAGKDADLIVLSGDPYRIPTHDLRGLRCLQVITAGRTVHGIDVPV